jgi:sugar phosphate isomerase/epimerase
MIHQDGQGLVGPDGEPIKLIAPNAGGWLHFESWMWGEGIRPFSMHQHAERHVIARLEELYGQSVAQQLITHIYERFLVEADFETMAVMGFNAVRLPLNHEMLEGEDGFTYLDRAVDWGEAHGVHVIVDMHAAPGGQSSSFPADPDDTLLWDDADARARLVALWGQIAARYVGRTGVGAYDLLNEPDAPDGAQLVSMYEEILSAIRAVDPDHLVMIEGDDLAMDFTVFDRRLDENMVYQAHQYIWFDLNPQDNIDGLAALAACHDVPIWLGEFGENHAPDTAELRQAYDAAGFAGWGFWPWKKVPTGNYPGLVEIEAPEDFLKLAKDVTDATGSPGQLSEAQARAAVTGFLDAAQPGRMRCVGEVAAALGVRCE